MTRLHAVSLQRRLRVRVPCYHDDVSGQEQSVAEAFASLVGQQVEDERIPLDRAALTIARTEYPQLEFAPHLSYLDELAHRVKSRLSSVAEPRETIAALNQVLFDEEQFRGNRDNYYDPRNSFLNDVLEWDRLNRQLEIFAAAPNVSAVTAASSATGKSPVPAVTTRTEPAFREADPGSDRRS